MPGRNDDRWKRLCEQASQEQDPKRLMELVQEINALLRQDAPQTSAPDSPNKTLKGSDAA